MVTHASPESRTNGVPFFSSFIEFPLTRFFHGKSFFFWGFTDSTGGGIDAAKFCVEETIGSATTSPSSISGTSAKLMASVATSTEWRKLGFSIAAIPFAGVTILQESSGTWMAAVVGDSGTTFNWDETEPTPAEFGETGGGDFELEEPEAADPVGIPRGGFFFGLGLPMRGGGDRRRDRRRWRVKEEDRVFLREKSTPFRSQHLIRRLRVVLFPHDEAN